MPRSFFCKEANRKGAPSRQCRQRARSGDGGRRAAPPIYFTHPAPGKRRFWKCEVSCRAGVFGGWMDPSSLISQGPLPEMWQFPTPGIQAVPRTGSGGESTVTGQSGGSRGRRKRREAVAAVTSEDESSKLASTSSGNGMADCEARRLKVNGDCKPEADASSGVCNKPTEQNTQPSEPPKQDYIHVRARRGQATDSHSLAERARREKISERMKILQDLVPGCNKVIGKASILDEIINYIQALQRQVELLSMKLETVNSRLNISIEGFTPKDFGAQTYDTSSSLPFGSEPTREYEQGSAPEWLHMQVGGTFERVT